METNQPGMRAVGLSTVTIAVDQYDGKEMSGRFCDVYDGRLYRFDSTLMLLRLLDAFFDACQMPQAAHRYRSFSTQDWKPALSLSRFEITEGTSLSGHGSHATFVLRVHSRQGADWQGCLRWMELHQQQYFRSGIELLHLMDEALDTTIAR